MVRRITGVEQVNPTTITEIRCTCCGEVKKTARFPHSYSELYKANGGRVPVCDTCLAKKYDDYLIKYDGDIYKSVYRICQKLDVYYNKDIVDSIRDIGKESKRIKSYISKTNLRQYKNKTFDTTLEENDLVRTIDNEDDLNTSTSKVTKKMVKFWGYGFKDEDYLYLDEEYKDWISKHECQGKNQEVLFKRLCFTQLNILKAEQKGEPTEKLDKSLKEILDSLNLQPKQNKNELISDEKTLSMFIKEYEDNNKIECDPKYVDIDNILLTSKLFFKGGVACGIMGKDEEEFYTKEELEELDKWTVKMETVQNEEEVEDDLEEYFNDNE